MKTNVNLSLFLSLFLLPHIVNAFDITQILDQYPDFSTFNTYLTQANLVTEINSRQTITVLVVENSNMSPLSGKPTQVLANIMSVHVILDYFDVPKLQMLPEAPTTLTTLFQTTGRARGQQGFINVTRVGTDGIAFRSPTVAAGSTPGSNLVKSVFTQPYNISVLQISNLILPPRADAPARVPSQSPAPTPSKSQAPVASPSGTQAPSMSPKTSPPVSPITIPPTSSTPLPGAETPTVAVDPLGPSAEAPATETPPAAVEHSKPASGAGKPIYLGLAVVFTVGVSTLSLAMRV